MGRISIDDELHADIRFKRLVRRLGDEDRAIGLLYRFWRLAQDYWGDECALIPIHEFEAEDFRPLAEVGLAEQRGDGYYASGSEERFGWYLQRCRAGRERAKANRDEAGRFQRNTPSDPTAPDPAGEKPSGTVIPYQPPLRTAPYRSASYRTDMNTTHASESKLSDEVKEATQEWEATLRHFEISRAIGERDQITIARAVQAFGLDWVKLAFQGARKQSKGPRFDPKEFVSLSIYLHKDRIERLVNIGAGKESTDGIDWAKVFA